MQFEADVTIAAPEISKLTEQTADFLSQRGVDARAAHHVALVLDELLSNLATHGGSANQTAKIRISIEPGQVRGELVDAGPSFDPRTAPDPDVSADIADRPIGGLGLLLVRRLTSGLEYVRRDRRNYTAFSVPRTTQQAEGQ